MSDDVLTVTCPCCRAVLTVDSDSGDVLMHKEVIAKPVVDITQAVQEIRKGTDRRDELFKKSVEEQKRRGSLLGKQFEEGLKRAKDDPTPPPPRDIDLD
jgi:hypothetical protein